MGRGFRGSGHARGVHSFRHGSRLRAPMAYTAICESRTAGPAAIWVKRQNPINQILNNAMSERAANCLASAARASVHPVVGFVLHWRNSNMVRTSRSFPADDGRATSRVWKSRRLYVRARSESRPSVERSVSDRAARSASGVPTASRCSRGVSPALHCAGGRASQRRCWQQRPSSRWVWCWLNAFQRA